MAAVRGKASKTKGVRAVERALDILEAFTQEKPALGIMELSKRVGLSRPTLYRLLSTLERRGFVRQQGDPPRYRLDAAAARLADLWMISLDLGEVAAPLMAELLDRLDETVALFVREGAERICVRELPSRQPLSFARGIGYTESLRHGASGHAILAFLPESAAEAIIGEERDAAGRRALRAKLGGVRKRGYAVSGGELIVGATAIAAPVFGRDGEAIGALGVFGPAARFTDALVRDSIEGVTACASALSSSVGFRTAARRGRAAGRLRRTA